MTDTVLVHKEDSEEERPSKGSMRFFRENRIPRNAAKDGSLAARSVTALAVSAACSSRVGRHQTSNSNLPHPAYFAFCSTNVVNIVRFLHRSGFFNGCITSLDNRDLWVLFNSVANQRGQSFTIIRTHCGKHDLCQDSFVTEGNSCLGFPAKNFGHVIASTFGPHVGHT